MNIDEIEHVEQGGVNLSRINRNGEEGYGPNHEIDNYDFMTVKQGSYDAYYLIDDNNEIIAATVIAPTTLHDGSEYLKIAGVYVRRDKRGSNLAIKMYHAIKHTEGMNLMSDFQQTSDGRKLWQKLSKTFNVGVLDVMTGIVVSQDINDAYAKDADNLVLVTETKIVTESLIIPPLKIGAIKR